MSFMSTLSLKSTIEEAWVREILGKYQLYPSNLLPSPLTKKLPRILWGKIGKGRRLVGFNTSGVKVGHKLC